MTDLQVKYWDLKSQEKLREAQAAKAIADAGLSKAQEEKVITLTPAEYDKLRAETNNLISELSLIKEKTELTRVQQSEAVANLVNKYTDSASKISSELRQWLRPQKSGGNSGSLTQIIAILGKILLA